MPSHSVNEKPRDKASGLRIAQNGGWLLGGKTIGAVLSLVYLAVITRSLGPTGFGTFAMVFSFAQLVSGLVSFQTWQIIIRFGTPHVLERQNKRFGQLIALCLVFDGVALVLGAILAVAGTYGLSLHYQWSHAFSIFNMVFCCVILLASRATVTGILRVHDRFRDAALGDTLVPVIRFAGVLCVVIIAPSVINFLIIWAVSEIIPTIIMWLLILRFIPLHLKWHGFGALRHYYDDYPGIGSYAAFSNLGSSLRLVSQQFVVVVVGLYTGQAAAGFFRLGHQLGQVLARIADGLGFVLFTEYNRISHQHGHDAATSLITRTLKVTGITATVLILMLILFGKPMIGHVFGIRFLPAYPLVILLGGAAAVQVAAMALEPVLLSRGQAGQALIANAIGVAVLIALLVVIMPNFGAIGAAVSVLAATVITTLCLVVAYNRHKPAGIG
jgi:O-antigen/teichoic acid export membrane protein